MYTGFSFHSPIRTIRFATEIWNRAPTKRGHRLIIFGILFTNSSTNFRNFWYNHLICWHFSMTSTLHILVVLMSIFLNQIFWLYRWYCWKPIRNIHFQDKNKICWDFKKQELDMIAFFRQQLYVWHFSDENDKNI